MVHAIDSVVTTNGSRYACAIGCQQWPYGYERCADWELIDLLADSDPWQSADCIGQTIRKSGLTVDSRLSVFFRSVRICTLSVRYMGIFIRQNGSNDKQKAKKQKRR